MDKWHTEWSVTENGAANVHYSWKTGEAAWHRIGYDLRSFPAWAVKQVWMRDGKVRDTAKIELPGFRRLWSVLAVLWYGLLGPNCKAEGLDAWRSKCRGEREERGCKCPICDSRVEVQGKGGEFSEICPKASELSRDGHKKEWWWWHQDVAGMPDGSMAAWKTTLKKGMPSRMVEKRPLNNDGRNFCYGNTRPIAA
jgi:hypothetical protein